MRWLLDTNACIRYLNGRAPNLKRRIDQVGPTDLVVCAVVKAELFFGSARSQNPVKSRQQQDRFLSRFSSLAFDDAAADVYGNIRAALSAAGTPIGPNDLMIAAIAIANGVTIVTNNTAEFSRVPKLTIEDWEVATGPTT